MKLKLTLLTLSLASVLTACQTSPTPSQTPTQKEVVNVNKDFASTLRAYTWAYQPQDSKTPIELSFNNDRLSIYSGCNRMGTSFEIKAQTLSTGIVMSTQMACDGLMQQEQFAANMFDKQKINFTIEQKESPILTLTTSDGKKYQFTGTATAETKYQSKPDIIFMEVAAQTKPCVGVAQQQCLQVREIKYNEQGVKTATGEWQLFYDQIEGFEHDAKVRTVLRLKRFNVKHPAAEQSKYAYVKDMVVEQEWLK